MTLSIFGTDLFLCPALMKLPVFHLENAPGDTQSSHEEGIQLAGSDGCGLRGMAASIGRELSRVQGVPSASTSGPPARTSRHRHQNFLVK